MSLALAKLLDGPVLHGGTQILVRDDGKVQDGGCLRDQIGKDTDIVPDYCRTWIKAYEARNAGDKEQTLKFVRQATAGFVATADLPPSDFMPEMMELYPEAKVVLVRRDPQKWWNSVAALTSRTTPWWLGVAMAPIPGWRHLPTFAKEYSRSTLLLAGLTEKTASPVELIKQGGPRRYPLPSQSCLTAKQALLADILEAHHEKVRSLVPKAQLLEMDLSEGWGPLCRFLDVPEPNEPFPRANDAKVADEYATKVLLKVLGVWIGIFVMAGITIYSGISLWRAKIF